MAPPQTSTTARAAAFGPPAPNPTTAPEPAPMCVSAMDIYLPIIPDPKTDDIERRFKHPTLTTIENELDHKQMCIVCKELFLNAIAIKSMFGGKKHGHLGSVQRPAVYHTEAGQAWTILTSGGMYPTFSLRATHEEKKREVTEFINRETHINIAELIEELLKNQLLKAVSEEYYMEPHQGVLQYNRMSTLYHIVLNTEY